MKSLGQRKRTGTRARQRCRALRIERLEERRVLATFMVTSLSDSGPGTLREAIEMARFSSSRDDILFDPGLTGETIRLDSPLPSLNGELRITGPSSRLESITIDAQRHGRVFNIERGSVSISNLTIAGGNSGSEDGGGILNSAFLKLNHVAVTNCTGQNGGGIRSLGELQLEKVIVSDNRATSSGGGVFSSSELKVYDSTVADNSAEAGDGGGMYIDLASKFSAEIRSSTVSDNYAGGKGGGVFVAFAAPTLVQDILALNSTIAHNKSMHEGGGLFSATRTSLEFTTVANNEDLSGSVTGAGGVATDGSPVFLAACVVAENSHSSRSNNNLAPTANVTLKEVTVTDDDVLGPLQDNGGLTQTMLPLPGTDIIDNAFPDNQPVLRVNRATDQRGFHRPVDFDRDGVAIRDRGAVELGVHLMQPFAVGAGPGSLPLVKVYDYDGQLKAEFLAFSAKFGGGVRVALGDVTGDGVQDILCAAGPGGGPHVRVFDGVSLSEVHSFFAYGPNFTGGVYIAAGDINFDGIDDVILGAGEGGGPHVRVLYGHNFADMFNFFPYPATFTGGVRVAAGRVNNDVFADIIMGAGPGGGPHVRIYSGSNLALLGDFFAFDPAFTGGVFVTAQNVSTLGDANVIVSAGAGGAPLVRAFPGAAFRGVPHLPPQSQQDFDAYSADFSGGVRVATVDINGDSIDDYVTGAGPGGGPHVRMLNGVTLEEIDSFFALEPDFAGGLFVGA